MNTSLTTRKDKDGNIFIQYKGSTIAWIHKESLALRDVKFWADGEVLIQLQQICWTLIPNGLYPYIWDSESSIMETNKLENGGISIHIEADSLDGSLSDRSELSICFSDEKKCLVYHVKQVLKVNREYRWFTTVREIDGISYAQLEYTDPYFKHIAGPAVPVTGFWPGIWLPGQECGASQWNKRWQLVIYEREDGVLEGCRHHHSIFYAPWKVKKHGFLGVFDDRAGNPVYHFLGDTADKGYVEQCTWGFDLHFVYMKAIENPANPGAGEGVLGPGEVYEAEYEIAALTSVDSREILAQAVISPLTSEQKQALDYPVYEAGINRFGRSAEIADMHAFSWEKSGDGAVWDKTFGYDDTFSLKLQSNENAGASWKKAVGQENFMQALEAGAVYKLSAFIYTKDLTGAGCKAGVGFGVPRYPGRSGEVFPVEWTWFEAERDTVGWKYIEVVTPEAPGQAIWAAFEFRLEGGGCVWIDNVEFCRI